MTTPLPLTTTPAASLPARVVVRGLPAGASAEIVQRRVVAASMSIVRLS